MSWITWVEKDAVIQRRDGSSVQADLFKDVTGSVYFVDRAAQRRVYVDRGEENYGWVEVEHQPR